LLVNFWWCCEESARLDWGCLDTKAQKLDPIIMFLFAAVWELVVTSVSNSRSDNDNDHSTMHN
jgi:hypothetical protein